MTTAAGGAVFSVLAAVAIVRVSVVSNASFGHYGSHEPDSARSRGARVIRQIVASPANPVALSDFLVLVYQSTRALPPC